MRFPQRTLAAMLGVHRQALNRTLKGFEEQGLASFATRRSRCETRSACAPWRGDDVPGPSRAVSSGRPSRRPRQLQAEHSYVAVATDDAVGGRAPPGPPEPQVERAAPTRTFRSSRSGSHSGSAGSTRSRPRGATGRRPSRAWSVRTTELVDQPWGSLAWGRSPDGGGPRRGGSRPAPQPGGYRGTARWRRTPLRPAGGVR